MYRPAPTGAWQLLATVAWAFLIVGGLDVGLVWYPAAFGNAGWEFGSVTAMLNGFPLPVMGSALLLASGLFTPEPLSTVLLGTGLLGFGLVDVRRRRRRASK